MTDSELAYDAAKWLKARAKNGGDEMTEEDKRMWSEIGKNCLTDEDLADLWTWFRR